jgi:hypothetical protein
LAGKVNMGRFEMKMLLLLAAVVMLNACVKEDERRYQMVARETGIFRMDTKTGEIDICGFNDKQQRIICAPSPHLINPQPETSRSKPSIYDGIPLAPDQPK